MAVTSIWRVKANLSQAVEYVENPSKTTALENVLEYAVNEKKTALTDMENAGLVHRYVSGVNCCPSTALEEMRAVKRQFGKEEGTLAYHGYQSFAEGEVTPEMAHEIGVKLAEKLWGEKYQVVVATHLDRQSHLHNHFLVNTVSFVDGIKYHRTQKDYRDMQRLSDELCREYQLSVVENPQPGKSKHYGEWKAEQEQRPTWRGLVKSDVDTVIRQSMTERQFFDNLRKMGYTIKTGKDISVRPPGKERFVRLARNFGEEYTLEGIRQRILGQQRPELPLPEPPWKPCFRRMKGSFQKTKKVTGFRALYFHYCYLLGYFPRDRPQNRKKLHFLLREDLLKLESLTEEIKLLARYRIDTGEQLFSCRENLEGQIDRLLTERAGLNRTARKVGADSTEIRKQKQEISKELAILRKEVKLCDKIAARSQLIREKIQIVREDQQVSGKEKTEHDQHRRRGGTGSAVQPGRD